MHSQIEEPIAIISFPEPDVRLRLYLAVASSSANMKVV